jgi:radical SAM protein with 4Fe4S-binding SPASM domain
MTTAHDAQSPPSHALERILAHPAVRVLFRLATIRHRDGTTPFERICEHYDDPGLRGLAKLKWALPTALISHVLRRKGIDRESAKRKLFRHESTVRALALTARSIGHYGLTEPQRYVAPLMVVWNITEVCNLSCKHCYQESAPRRARDEMTLEQKLHVVDQLGANGVPLLAIAGGEPLACRDLWPVLEAARRNRIHVTLASNGTLITPEIAARLKDAGVKYIEISVDSASPAEHDGFRAQAGAWARATQGIRYSVDAGIDTGLATCLTRRTAAELDALVDLAVALGCDTFSHFNFIPVGRGRDMSDLDLAPAEREKLLQRLNVHLQADRMRIVSTAPQFGRACIQYGPDDGYFATGHGGRGKGQKTQVLSRYVGGCGAGRCYCAIEPNGVVTPCVYIRTKPVGDLRTERFADVWNNQLFAVLSDRNNLSGHCRVCDYRSYCGGCRARALAYTGDITAPDPGCIENERLWEKLTAEDDSSSPRAQGST